MSEFIVHSIPGSPYGRAVLAVLVEKGADFALHPLAPGQHRIEPHIVRHPFGRVPAFEHRGFALYETQAILRYLDRILPEPALSPADPCAAARMDQVMAICDWYLFQGVSSVIAFQRIVGPRLMGLTPDEGAIAEAMPRAHTVFAELSRLLGEQSYFAGDTASLADFMAACHLDFLAQTPEWAPLTDGRANLPAWLERMSERPSMIATTWARAAQMAAQAA